MQHSQMDSVRELPGSSALGYTIHHLGEGAVVESHLKYHLLLFGTRQGIVVEGQP